MSEGKLEFQKLTPKSDVDIKVYERAIDFAFDNDDVTNIAISGAYGAGKSSVIETYKSQHYDKKFLHISMAHFSENDEKDNIGEKKISKVDEKYLLEGKILNQLVHQIKPEKIPQTNFVIKRQADENTRKYIIKNVSMFVIGIILWIYICFFQQWNDFVVKLNNKSLVKLIDFTTERETLLFIGIGAVVITIFFLYEIVKYQYDKRIVKKINISGNNLGIELFSEPTDSYFDKYLNEVLYLFENAGADAIVFEDIDRFNTNYIFEKLREINVLVNRRNNLNENDEKVIRFIYLLRDDMFISKERTKFFDFIIPVVPVIDGSNSYEKFRKQFLHGGVFNLFDDNFLKDLSLYIDDMRMLNNIYNEFLIYKNELDKNKIEPDYNKMLAMIVFKNIFPSDFSNLQLGKGYVYTLFKNKDDFCYEENEKLKEQIENCKKEIIVIKKEKLSNIDELDAIYYIDNHAEIRIGDRESTSYATREEYIKAVKENNYEISYVTRSYYGSVSWKNENVKHLFDQLSNDLEYSKRKKIIEKKNTEEIRKIESRMHEYEKQLDKLQSKQLKDIITTDNRNKIFMQSSINELGEKNQFKEIKRSDYFPLIEYLIRRGYIDETYADYMTYFYEGSISPQEKVFLRRITDEREQEDYSYEISNVEEVISRIRISDFSKKQVLNYKLLDFLLEHSTKYSLQLERLLQQIYSEENVKFIQGFIKTNRNIPLFIERLNNLIHNAVSWIITNEQIEGECKRIYIIFTLLQSNEQFLTELNQEDIITNHINSDKDFLQINNVDINELVNKMKMLSIKMFEINVTNSDKDFLNKIYENNLYQLNRKNLDMFIGMKYNIQNLEMCRNNYLTVILSQEQPMKDYVKSEMNAYMNIYFDMTEQITDAEDITLFVINNTQIELELRKEYINRWSMKIKYIVQIDDKEIWPVVIRNNIEYSIDNLLDYYFLSGSEMDDNLIYYINGCNVKLSFLSQEVDNKYGEDASKKLFLSIIEKNKIEDEKYITLLSFCNRVYNDGCSVEGIDENKMNLIISKNIISMSEGGLNSMRKYYPNNVKYFIFKNIQKYCEIINEELFEFKELLYVLDMEVEDKNKFKLLQFETKKISVIGKQYSDEVIVYILNNNFDSEDMEELFKSYSKNREKVKNAIFDIAINNIKTIIEERMLLAPELCSNLLKLNKIGSDNKKKLLAINLEKFTIEEILNILCDLKLVDYQSLLNGKRPKIEVTTSNKMLLEALRKKQLISSFKIDEQDENYYRTYGKKSKKGK